MNKIILQKISGWAFWCFVVIWVVLLFIGCQPQPVDPSPIGPLTPHEAFIKIVTSTNWAYVVGALATSFGVMSTINGNTKGVGIVGGGITLMAIILMFTRWGEAMTWVLAVLAVGGLCLWLANHLTRSKIIGGLKTKFQDTYNLIDTNKDGKLDVEELKIALGIN